MPGTPEILDLDAERESRLRSRAAAREGRGDVLIVRFGGAQIAELGPEFPIDVLEPFVNLDLDIALLIQQVMNLASAEDQNAQLTTLDMIASVLAANPNLLRDFIGAAQQAGQRLFGTEGYEQFVALRPTPWDVAALLKQLMRWHGVTLGDFSSPPDSSAADGETPSLTSKPILESTSASSGPAPAQHLDGSASGASST